MLQPSNLLLGCIFMTRGFACNSCTHHVGGELIFRRHFLNVTTVLLFISIYFCICSLKWTGMQNKAAIFWSFARSTFFFFSVSSNIGGWNAYWIQIFRLLHPESLELNDRIWPPFFCQTCIYQYLNLRNFNACTVLIGVQTDWLNLKKECLIKWDLPQLITSPVSG